MRLSGISLTGTVDPSTCILADASTVLASAVLTPASTITCSAKHAATIPEFQGGSLSLQVTGSATAYGLAGEAAVVTDSSTPRTVTLTPRQTGTIAVQHDSDSTVAALGESCC